MKGTSLRFSTFSLAAFYDISTCMSSHEQAHNSETISQQFIAYVTSHSSIPAKPPEDLIREGSWNINVKLPLLADTIERVYFGERELEDHRGPTGKHGYDISIYMRSGLIADFTHEPSSPSPFTFSWGEASIIYDIQEEDIVNLLNELKTHEASGKMTKAEPPSDDLR